MIAEIGRAALFAAVLLAVAACGPAGAPADTPVDAPADSPAGSGETSASAPEPSPPPAALRPDVDLNAALSYPRTRSVAVTDILHGVSIEDPYRWLEADARLATDVADWVTAQSSLSRAYLDTLPGREAVARAVTAAWSNAETSAPVARGQALFFVARAPDDLQPRLYVQDSPDAGARVIADPSLWSSDASTALTDFWPSPSGALVAYAIQEVGSDWRTIRVIDASTGALIPYAVEWTKHAPVVWAPDGSGFYYARYPEPASGLEHVAPPRDQALYFHALDAPQTADVQVYARPDDPDAGYHPWVTANGRWLVISVWRDFDPVNDITLIDLTDLDAAPVRLVEGLANTHAPVRMAGRELIVRTDRDAPRGRLVAINLDDPASLVWRDVIQEDPQATLVDVDYVSGVYIAQYRQDGRSQVRRFNRDGELIGAAPLPGPGVATGFDGGLRDRYAYFSYAETGRAPGAYRLDVQAGVVTPFVGPHESATTGGAAAAVDPTRYVVEDVDVAASDGARVRVRVSYKQGLDREQAQPLILTGHTHTPDLASPLSDAFDPVQIAWMELGGVWARAVVRGEAGVDADWRAAGRGRLKDRAWADIIETAEQLIADGWTSSAQFALYGRGHAGLMVGAVVNQRPDLFAAAAPVSAPLDMLRYGELGGGRFWRSTYGGLRSQAEFAALYDASPYHTVRSGADYPAVLASASDRDTSVAPAHSFKYAAALQAARSGDAPTLLRIDPRVGLAGLAPIDARISEATDVLAFAAYHVGLDPTSP